MSSHLALDMHNLLTAERDQNWADFLEGGIFSLQMLHAILYHLTCLTIGHAQLPSYGNELGRSSSSSKPFSNFVDLPSQRLQARTAMHLIRLKKFQHRGAIRWCYKCMGLDGMRSGWGEL